MQYKYEKLEVWQLSKGLIGEVYALTSKFPQSENYCLTSQTRRAVTSVSLNIAEGDTRASRKEFAQFIRISLGSLIEVDTCLKIAIELKYINQKEYDEKVSGLIEKIYFKLIALERSIKI